MRAVWRSHIGELPDDVKPGDTILIDDGLIGLEVKKIQKVSGAKADAEEQNADGYCLYRYERRYGFQ